jgi:carboxymethylenebutenolidase
VKTIVTLAALVVAPVLALAQNAKPGDAKPAADANRVTYKSGADEISSFLALPKNPKKAPAVIVIQEWWGLNDWVKDQARALAAEGYVALAPDLYRGKVAANPDEAHQLMRGLPEDRALRDLNAAVDYLKSRPEVNADAIGCVGFCMGGGYALSLAVDNASVKACDIYYGRLLTDDAQLAKIRAAVLGNFGAEDKGIPPDAVKAFEASMKKLGKSVDVKIYPGAGHAFANANNKEGYNADAAKDAWSRTLSFFKKTLSAS